MPDIEQRMRFSDIEQRMRLESSKESVFFSDVESDFLSSKESVFSSSVESDIRTVWNPFNGRRCGIRLTDLAENPFVERRGI